MEDDHIFSVDNTLVAKGLFIIAVLAHHLFSARSCIPRTWMLVEPWHDLAILGKVAVHGFFLLSGYGLMRSMSARPCSVLDFYRKVFIRTYAQFWPVFVLALIPLLFDASGMTFSVVWPSLWNFLLDALGLAHLVPGAHQYNPTWWFLSALLVMYAVFPLVRLAVCRMPVEFAILMTWSALVPSMWWFCDSRWPFVIGVYLARYDLFSTFGRLLRWRRILIAVLLIVLFGGLHLLTVKGGGLAPSELFRWDPLLAIGLILTSWQLLPPERWCGRLLRFIGSNSMNIFLTHTFVFGIYLHAFSYGLKYPILILFQLLAVSLTLSVALRPLQRLTERGLLALIPSWRIGEGHGRTIVRG